MAAKPHSPMPHDRMTVDGQKKRPAPEGADRFCQPLTI